MPKGKVKWFDKKKRYGFIESEDGMDFFVHSSSIVESDSKILFKGQAVTFDISQREKGPAAIQVQVKGKKHGMKRHDGLMKSITRLTFLVF